MSETIHKEKHENSMTGSHTPEQSESNETHENKLNFHQDGLSGDQIMLPESETLEDMSVPAENVTGKEFSKAKTILCSALGIMAVIICCAMNLFPLAGIIALFTIMIALSYAKSSRIGIMLGCGLMILTMIGYFMIQMNLIGRTRCCDGTWSNSTGKGACAHHGGVCSVHSRTRCCDGTWSNSTGKGACAHHGGVCKK